MRCEAAVPAIVSGDGHYLALTDSGLLYSWGRNDFGQLGLGGKPPATWGGPTSPAIVPPPPGLTWAAVATGDNHSLAIDSDGSLWAWGRNDATQLSFRTSPLRRWLGGGMREPTPVRISSVKTWMAVSGGMLSSFALKRDGSLWAWGGNWMGQLGNEGGTFTEFGPPVEKLSQLSGLNRIGRDTDWVRINAGCEHVLAQKRDGTLWAWGRNDCGQLGIGTFTSTNRPVRIPSKSKWVMFAAGGGGQRGAWSAGIKPDGTLWVWGNWKRLRLPAGAPNSINTNFASLPVQLGTAKNWVHVACGNELGAAVKMDGTLWTWGNTTRATKLPDDSVTLQPLGEDHDWSRVTVDGRGLGTQGNMHAVEKDGTVWTWNPEILPAQGISPAGSSPNGEPHQILRLRESLKKP